MSTPAQLRDRLLELGIDRDLRALTDWRQKGLLPPLQRASSGRGRGVKRYWSGDVLDQAIAVDWHMKRCGRADEALLGLWLSGYRVDAAKAKRAWIQQLKRVQHRRQMAASRYSGGFSGLGRGWWRRLQTNEAFSMPWWRDRTSSDLQSFSDFLGDTHEWMRDDVERDDDAYRNQIAELITRLTKADRKRVYRRIDRMWAAIEPASIFAITPSIEFVESISLRELHAAQRSVTSVTTMLRHALQLNGLTGHIPSVIRPLALMRDFLGPLVAKSVIKVNREIPELPLEQTILSLQDFVMGVQSTDIAQKNDGSIHFSERIQIEWRVANKKLLRLWIRARNKSANQPATPNGHPDHGSG
jgi:hypothetical protein